MSNIFNAALHDEGDETVLRLKACEALRLLADAKNWSESEGCEAWIGSAHTVPKDLASYALDLITRVSSVSQPAKIAYEVHECRECSHRIMSDEKLCCPHNLKTPPLRVVS